MVVWVCLVMVIDVAVGHGMQLVVEKAINQSASASEQAREMDTYAQGECPRLDEYVDRSMTIDELDDLRDQVCPTLSEPQRAAN
jgi:hypothetical protein